MFICIKLKLITILKCIIKFQKMKLNYTFAIRQKNDNNFQKGN